MSFKFPVPGRLARWIPLVPLLSQFPALSYSFLWYSRRLRRGRRGPATRNSSSKYAETFARCKIWCGIFYARCWSSKQDSEKLFSRISGIDFCQGRNWYWAKGDSISATMHNSTSWGKKFIIDSGLGQIANYVGGALLDLSDSALSSLSAVMQPLPSLRTFRRLDLSRNELVSLRSLCGLPMLERLDVSNNRCL